MLSAVLYCFHLYNVFIYFYLLFFSVSGDRLKLLLSFAVGGLLGDVFLHLLPEAWNLQSKQSPIRGEYIADDVSIMIVIRSTEIDFIPGSK